MGAGRKTTTVNYATTHRPINPDAAHRMLRDELGGVIFGCTKDTFQECMEGGVFGLPRNHFSYVEYIEEGMPLFLFNYTGRRLHGIYRATSAGQMEINPRGWCLPGERDTRYPAQVQYEVFAECPPLHEKEWKSILADNYYSNSHFKFELTEQQASQLCQLFHAAANKSQGGVNQAPAARGAVRSSAGTAAPAARPAPAFQPAPPPAVSAWGRSVQHDPPPAPPAREQKPEPTSAQGQSSQIQNNDWHEQVVRTQTPREVPAPQPAPEPQARPPMPQPAPQQAPMPAPPQPQAPRPYNPPAPEPSPAPQPVYQPPVYAAAPVGQPPPGQGPPRPAVRAYNPAGLQQAPPQAAPAAAPRPYAPPEQAAPPQPPQPPQPEAQPQASSAAAYGTADAADQTAFATAEVPQGPANAEEEEGTAGLPALTAQMQRHYQQLVMHHQYIEQFSAGMAATRSEHAGLEARCATLEQANLHLSSEVALLREEVHKLTLLITTGAQLPRAEAARQPLDDAPAAAPPSTKQPQPTPSAPPIREPALHQNGAGHPTRAEIESTTAPEAHLEEGEGRAGASQDWLYIIGGCDTSDKKRETVSRVDCFDVRSGALSDPSLTPLPVARSYAGLVCVGRHLYCIGGGVGSEWYSSVERYAIDEDAWERSLRPMASTRGSLGVGLLGGKIYAVGGGVGHTHYDTVEEFDIEQGTWAAGPSMTTKRFALSCAVAGGSVYAVGGCQQSTYLNSVERLDPREGRWAPVQPMLGRRGSSGAAVMGDNIYVVAGFNGTKALSTVEVYEPRADAWRQLGSMAHQRAYSSACVLDGVLYGVGGIRETGQGVEVIERYDEAANTWEAIESPCPALFNRVFAMVCAAPARGA